MNFNHVAIPINVLEDINTLESRRWLVAEISQGQEAIFKLHQVESIIKNKDDRIAELEQQVDDLQKALDTVLLNKCRTRKVKVKVYGRSPVDKTLHRHVR